MTAQLKDMFRFCDTHFVVEGLSTGTLFDPAVLGLVPGPCISTACYRANTVVFSIVDLHLVVADLRVNLAKKGPAINGVMPTRTRSIFDFLREPIEFNTYYQGLDYRLDYSGGLLLGDSFIREWRGYGWFLPVFAYEKVIELVFKNGAHEQQIDRSEIMAEVRRKMAEVRQMQDHYNENKDLSILDDIENEQVKIRKFADEALGRTYKPYWPGK